MSISEHFRYRNDVFQSDIFVSDIGITDVDVGCRISPTLRSMLMPTYDIQFNKYCGVVNEIADSHLYVILTLSPTCNIFLYEYKFSI
jgi:hypothetical protein